LQLNQAYNLSFPAEICDGETFYMPDGTGEGAQGIYNFMLQTTDGCDSIVTIELVVQSLPDVSIGANDSYCPYDGNITLSPDPLGGTLSGDLLNGNELEHEGALPGNYEVSYSFTDGNGCNFTEVQEYVLTAPIEPSFNFNLICNELQLESTTPDPMEDHLYLWHLDDESIAVFAEPLFFFEQSGTFDLGLTVTDIFGCNYSVTESVILENEIDLTGFFVPNVITPNGDDYNDKLSLPPEVASCFDYTIDIYNRWGDLIYIMTQDTPGFSGRNQNGNEVPDGVYFYTLEIENHPCSELPELTQWCTGKLSVFRN
jgi:gliding motility-associated-like protein